MRALALAFLLVATVAPLSSPASVAADAPPDLRVSDAWVNGTLVEGDGQGFDAILENGGAPTDVDVVVRFSVDDAWSSDAVLHAGASGYVTISAPERWSATLGWHTLKVEVDATGAQAESDESNNVWTGTFEVKSAAPPPPPPPARETLYTWAYGGNATALTSSADIFLPQAHVNVWYDMTCTSSTMQVYLDGQLVASCVQGVRTLLGSTFVDAGFHRFRVVYAGMDTGYLEVSGVAFG